MSKPIMLTDELLAKIQEEFISNVKNMKMFDGKLNYTKNFKWDSDERASVTFSAAAFAKMTMLVQNFDSEVAWHGVAYRDEGNPTNFYITDILVYPQIVTGSTVNTDQEGYTAWLYGLEDEVFNNVRMQGHSHVNFGVTPSPVDTEHQGKILEQIDKDMFYIFMIWNKKFDKFIKIYDMANNTLYETGDVDVFIGNEGIDLDAFLKDAKDQVKKKTYTTTTNQYKGYQKPGTTTTTPAATTTTTGAPKSKPKNKDKPAIGSGYKPSGYNPYGDDDDSAYGGCGYYNGYGYYN